MTVWVPVPESYRLTGAGVAFVEQGENMSKFLTRLLFGALQLAIGYVVGRIVFELVNPHVKGIVSWAKENINKFSKEA